LNAFRRIVSVSLLLVLSGLPALAQSDLRESHHNLPEGHLALRVTPTSVDFHFDAASGRVLRGTVSRLDGTFSLEGLTIQPTQDGLMFSLDDERVLARVDQRRIDRAVEDPAAVRLINRWRGTQNLDEIAALVDALQIAIDQQRTATKGIQTEQAELSCGWEIVGLVAVGGGAYVGCVTIAGCAFGFLGLLYQLKQTADACNWCGFGRAC
jgi:hypothetical protein